MREFYIIQRCPDGWHHHDTEEYAIKESIRLARKEGGKFRVFRVIGQAKNEGEDVAYFPIITLRHTMETLWWMLTAWRKGISR